MIRAKPKAVMPARFAACTPSGLIAVLEVRGQRPAERPLGALAHARERGAQIVGDAALASGGEALLAEEIGEDPVGVPLAGRHGQTSSVSPSSAHSNGTSLTCASMSALMCVSTIRRQSRRARSRSRAR